MNLGVTAVVCALVVGACSSHTASPPAPPTPPTSSVRTGTTLSPSQIAANEQARREVAVTSCGPDRRNHVEIKGTARNGGATVATYAVQLAIRDASGKH